MVGPNAQHSYYLYDGPADMRKSFNGLCGLVRNGLDRNPANGEVFVFLNRKRDMIKLLLWDRNGFVIYCKRLERGTFEHPTRKSHHGGIWLSWSELMLILEGIALDSVKQRKRYVLQGS